MNGDNLKNGIDKFCEKFNSAINSLIKPAIKLPSFLLYCSALQRPGLSSMAISSRIIKKIGDLGIPTGPNRDGSPNLINPVIYSIVQETVMAIKKEGIVTSIMPKGSAQIVSTFNGPGGTFTGIGTNITDIVLDGIMS